MSAKLKILVAMSGGVDSSAAALWLRDAGNEVLGATFAIGSDDRATRAAAAVCARLGIPHLRLDAREVFTRNVVEYFVAETAVGRTPNPCARCNPTVKFGWLLRTAREHGCERIATGHYAGIEQLGDRRCVRRGKDPAKDQSYFLFALDQEQLAAAVFPLADWTKDEVRAQVAPLNLPLLAGESQDLCFLGPGERETFLARRLPELSRPGPIRDGAGKLLGEHRGVAHYTIGQRQGLGLGGGPWYVAAVDVAANALIVSPREQLQHRFLEIAEANWMITPPSEPFTCGVAIRYQARPVPATVTPLGEGRAAIALERSQFAVTPGQAAVCYAGSRVLGGGWIEWAGADLREPEQ